MKTIGSKTCVNLQFSFLDLCVPTVLSVAQFSLSCQSNPSRAGINDQLQLIRITNTKLIGDFLYRSCIITAP